MDEVEQEQEKLIKLEQSQALDQCITNGNIGANLFILILQIVGKTSIVLCWALSLICAIEWNDVLLMALNSLLLEVVG